MADSNLERKLIEAQLSIADSLKVMSENLKTLNDHNILHSTEIKANQATILSKLKTLTDKYWWLIIVLIGVILLMANYDKAASILLPIV